MRHGPDLGPVPFVLELLRHGEARPAGAAGDSARRLTPSGRRSIEQLAASLAAEGWRPDRVFTSPLLRARDSARIVLEPTVPGLEPEMLDELATAPTPETFIELLDELGVAEGHVLLVGHQPLIGRLAHFLEGGTEREVPPGTFVRLECPEGLRAGRCHVSWYLKPGRPAVVS
jgi:phosphohistidine phosphatase